jgi:hypothetical protein
MKLAIIFIVLFASAANAALNATQQQLLIVSTQHTPHTPHTAQRGWRDDFVFFAEFIFERFSLLCKHFIQLHDL